MADTGLNGEFGIFWGRKLLQCPAQRKPLIESIINYRDICCIKAEKKKGKSVLMQQLAYDLTTGSDFLGIFKIDKPCNVLYIQTEDFRDNMVRRFLAMKKAVSVDENKLFHCVMSGARLHTREGLDDLIAKTGIPQVRFDVVIFDEFISPPCRVLYSGS